MGARLVIAIVSTVLEEVVLVVVVRWGLPQLGISIPLWGLVLLMLTLATYAIITYRMGSCALRKKPLAGLAAMVGSRGRVVSPLAPEGFIRIQSELWRAISADESKIGVGEEVIVVRQEGLKLIVIKSDSGGSKVV